MTVSSPTPGFPAYIKPGFYSLFRRGKLMKESVLPGSEKEHHQRERFAVSMIAFAMEYDNNFRRHFFHQYRCDVENSANEPDVLIEPEDWGDLVVTSDVTKRAWVFEFKIAAPLDDKQNPGKSAFWKDGGYGDAITNKLKGFQLVYTTIENGCSWSKPKYQNQHLKCRPESWVRLDRKKNQRSKIEDNLYTTLGNLGVWCFNPIIANNMKFGAVAKNAVQVSQCLNDIIDELKKKGVICEKPIPDLWREAETEQGSWCYGSGIPVKTNSTLGKALKTNANGKDYGMAWFGYEGDPPMLSVQFWCGKNHSVAVVSQVKAKGPKATVTHRGDEVHVSCSPQASKGDFKWFVSVFNSVLSNA